ncbi:hypothetical protein QKG38_11515 [Clavibacter michiganensis]|uniref:Integral membrane protein n=2 Tax=Clavibacter michiganensis subsp. michiganensis TaxID=33013 RepID=A0A1Y3FA55_CLAMM|nr:hypothetical protein [Clavibacter michiganensis]KAF0257526.1 hypothetical protein DOU02_12985 [Clavibacter michiganensis subsp. michiganensis]MBW8027814.1 hypothetical protein [Clavibacter michiganensis subsp. michiganensis]MDO4018963.1 hypothetical protein [Clavibacter michiganensis]MDO4026037.1 hypothetical protein [Clavibacter michiganensis]MDO4032648.1 hypothetical protein [Clavibacter michiganensis]
MIGWFTVAQVAVAVVAGVLCLVVGAIGRKPSDLTVLPTALVEVLLVVQLVIAIVAPSVGNPPSGSLIEFYAYLLSGLVIPPLAVFWALVERTRWSTIILGASCLAIAIMVYRMDVIWNVQSA